MAVVTLFGHRGASGVPTRLTDGPFQRGPVAPGEETFSHVLGRAWAKMVCLMMAVDDNPVPEDLFRKWCARPSLLRCGGGIITSNRPHHLLGQTGR